MYGHHPDPTVDSTVEAEKAIRIQKNFRRSLISVIIGLVVGIFVFAVFIMDHGFFYSLFVGVFLIGGYCVGGCINLIARSRMFIISFNAIIVVLLCIAFVVAGIAAGAPMAIFSIARYFVWKSRLNKGICGTEPSGYGNYRQDDYERDDGRRGSRRRDDDIYQL